MTTEYFNNLVKNKRVMIIIHESVKGGPGHTLRDFLLEKHVKEMFFVAHPLLYIKESYRNSSYFEKYLNSKLITHGIAYHWELPEPLLYCKDFIYGVFWPLLKTGEKYDLFIGYDPLNALMGLLLKKMEKVGKVVYFSIDYFPQRFENNVLNKLYHSVDKFCVKYVDETWNLSNMMVDAREKHNNMKRKIFSRQYTVPIGVWFTKLMQLKMPKRQANTIVYAGHFTPFMGIDLVIEAMVLVKKKFHDIHLEIIGGGEMKQELISRIKKLNLNRHIHFQDWITNRGDFHKTLSQYAIGMATFNTYILDDKVKNADPGKIKDYMVAGLPVITTRAISNYKILDKEKCALIVESDSKAIAKAIITILSNRSLLAQYRKNAMKYVSQFDYEEIFKKNLVRVLSGNK